jgi:hypothetical protein
MKNEILEFNTCLKQLKREANVIAGGWNGKDDNFTVGGTTYSKEDAHHAIEVIEACEQLEALLDNQN